MHCYFSGRGNRILFCFLFYSVKEYNIETESTKLRPILYSFRPIKLPIFCTLAISISYRKIYNMTNIFQVSYILPAYLMIPQAIEITAK